MILEYTGSHIPNFKNSKLARVVNGKTLIITDPKKQDIMKRMINSFNRFSKMPEGKIHLSAVFNVSDKRKRDLDGMLCTVMDCLVKAGIIGDDNIYIVSVITASVKFVDKGHEGVSICLLNLNE